MKKSSSEKYFYQSSCDILKELEKFINHKIEYNQIINEFLLNYEQSAFDYTWPLITTTLLMNEKLCGNEKIDAYLNNNESLRSIVDNIGSNESYNMSYGETISNQVLDENNNPLSNLDDLMDYSILENKIFYNDYFIEESFEYDGEEINIKPNFESGCNESIMSNGYIDVNKLISKIRIGIAHSNYKIIDNNSIRIFNYNENLKKMDLNIIINKFLVINIIDEINNKTREKYKEVLDEVNNGTTDYRFNKNLTDKEILNYLQSLNLFDLETCNNILEKAKKKSIFYKNSYHKIQQVVEIAYEKIKPAYKCAQILDEIILKKYKENEIYFDHLYRKYGEYNYYGEPFSKNEQKEEEFKLLLLTLINLTLSYGFNMEKEIDYKSLDFSKMQISESIKDGKIQKEYKRITEKEHELTEEKQKLETIKNNENKKLKINRHQLENNYKDNQYFNQLLPQRIKENEEKINLIIDKIKKINIKYEYYKIIFEINDLKDNINLTDNLSLYILEHIRNSLAHGNVIFLGRIDFKNIFDTKIMFKDYNPITKNKTFEGTITFKELLKIITSKKLIEDIYDDKSKKSR